MTFSKTVTGMGLFLLKRALELHNWFVESRVRGCFSRRHIGSVCVLGFYLPRTRPLYQPLHPARASPRPSSPDRTLRWGGTSIDRVWINHGFPCADCVLSEAKAVILRDTHPKRVGSLFLRTQLGTLVERWWDSPPVQ